MATAMDALADNWRFSASAGAAETYNHYIGQDQPSDGFVTTLIGALAIQGDGARVKLNGTVGGTGVFYAGQGQPDSFAPYVNLAGSVEAIEKFFYVDATATVTESFISPFGAQPGNLTTPTNNRYITQVYSVSPYIKGVIAPDISYLVRDDNAWAPSSSYGNSSARTPTTYYNNLNALLSSVLGNGGGWTLQYNRQSYDNGIGTGTYVIQVARGIASFAVDPQLTLSARGGYESDEFPALTGSNGALLPAQSNQGPIYGFGVNWRPTDRTLLNGYWEHQFFGSAYSWLVSHRLPNVALSAYFTRGITTYPQLALVIPSGVTVAQFLDAAFTTRIPDPAQRAAAVAEFLAQTGLPPTLASPLNFYAATVTVQQVATVSAVWIGALNTIAFTLFNSRSEAISGSGSALPPLFQFGANNTQTGGGVTYSHRLTGLTSLVASATYSRTTPTNTDEFLSNARSNNYNASVSLNSRLTPKTNAAVGVTYFLFDTPGSNAIPRQGTLGIYASIVHTF